MFVAAFKLVFGALMGFLAFMVLVPLMLFGLGWIIDGMDPGEDYRAKPPVTAEEKPWEAYRK